MPSARQAAMSWLLQRAKLRYPALYRDIELVAGRPTLQDLSLCTPVFPDALECLRYVLEEKDLVAWQGLSEEFWILEKRLSRRRQEVPLAYPSNFPVQTQTARLLYTLIRIVRPVRVLETGVADGYSAAIVLSALDRNGAGELHSVDIKDDVGVLVECHQDRWRLHVVDDRDSMRQLRRIGDNVKPVDIFFHDSDHRFVPQIREFELARAVLRPGGFLVSDDVDLSHAYPSFLERYCYRAATVLDSVKVSALMQVS